MSDLDEARRALELGAELDEQPETPTRGSALKGGDGTTGPQVGQSSQDPTTLADVSEPVGATEPKLASALKQCAAGFRAMRLELHGMVDAFKEAVPETRRGRGVASALRALQGVVPMLDSAEAVIARALGTQAPESEALRRVFELGDRLDEEPLTHTTDADRSTEPRKKLDATSQAVITQVGTSLAVMAASVRKLGYQLQGTVEQTTRPDGIRASVTDLSEADNVLTSVRQKIMARFKE